MKNIAIKYFIISLLSALVFWGCEDRNELTAPGLPNTGNADFTRFVSIGNSLTAGYQNSSLYNTSQEYSVGSLIAKQVGASYIQPLVSEPGIPGKLEVKQLIVKDGNIENAIVGENTGQGTPLNTTYAAPYNNLGVPGAILFDVTDTTDFTAKSAARGNPFFQLVLRSAAFGNSMLQQAINLNPTFITLWIGNNDVLGYATSGGTTGTDATQKLPTDPAVFQFLFSSIADALDATGAKVAVANIPDVNVVPFFTTVGPKVGLSLQAVMSQNPAVVGLFYQKNGETIASGLATPDDLFKLNVLLTLKGGDAATLIGDTTGAYYTLNQITVPPGIDTKQPFGLHPQNPWPDVFILDADEITVTKNALDSFNNTIAAYTGSHQNFALVDVNKLLNMIKEKEQQVGGYFIDGINFSTQYISGNLFSLDGVHPTTRGYGIVANEFISTINKEFGASLPLLNLSVLPVSVALSEGSEAKVSVLPIFENLSFDSFIF